MDDGACILSKVRCRKSDRYAVGAAGLMLLMGCSRNDRVLYVVNATGSPGLTVLVDGKEVASDLPVATGLASNGGMERIELGAGTHVVVAQDASGRVLESQEIRISERSYGYLFAPTHRPDACFEVRLTPYGTYHGSLAPEQLAPSSTIREMNHYIDRWFEASSAEVAVQKGQTGSHERALHMIPCAPSP